MAHVTVGCRDCKKCTNSGIANVGRNSGRIGVGVMTLGLSEAIMGATKNCRVCGHKLSLHSGSEVRSGGKLPPAGWYSEARSGRMRWWDGSLWGRYQDDPDPEVSAVSPDGSVGDELEQLVSLRERGVLSDEEFAAAKKRVLGL